MSFCAAIVICVSHARLPPAPAAAAIADTTRYTASQPPPGAHSMQASNQGGLPAEHDEAMLPVAAEGAFTTCVDF